MCTQNILFGNTGTSKKIEITKTDWDGGTKYDKGELEIVMQLHRWARWLLIHNTSEICSFNSQKTLRDYTLWDFTLEASQLYLQSTMKFCMIIIKMTFILVTRIHSTLVYGVLYWRKLGQKSSSITKTPTVVFSFM